MSTYTFTKDQINPDCLKQATNWFDARGRDHKIEHMSHHHAAGAMRKLFGAFGAPVMDTALYKRLQQQSRMR